MRFLSVCSGIEAASVAWNPLGWEAVGFSEIEPFPCALLKHHYPNVPNLGDMTKYEKWNIEGPVDLVCGGTPCQAFSVAGLRKGLADPRGNLSLVFLGIVDRLRPRWVVWENVPGVFSAVSHDAPDPVPPGDGLDVEREGAEMDTEDEYSAEELHAFGCFLAGLSELGYGWAYRVLDAQYFGVPQRRRRPFVVGYLGDWRRPAAVFFERHSLQGHPAPSREKGQGITGTLNSRPAAGGGLGTDFDCDGGLIAGTLNASGKAAGSATQQDAEAGNLVVGALPDGSRGYSADAAAAGYYIPAISPTVSAKWAKSSGGPSGDECQNLIAFQGGVCPSVGLGTLTASQGRSLASGGLPCVAYRVAGDGAAYEEGAKVAPLTTGTDLSATVIALNLRGREGGANLELSDLASLRAANGGSSRSHIAYTIHGQNSNAVQGPGPVAAFETEVARCLDAAGFTNQQGGTVALGPQMAVRRLTPRECERLQGFPDDYTLVPFRGKLAKDGPRYKALGNSWAVLCAAWLGRRIQMVEELC